MPDQIQPDFAAVNEEREKRVIQAILDFTWDDYSLNDVGELADMVKEDIREDGESDRMDWARDLAKAVLLAGRPLTMADVSNQDGRV
jgi:hypothetical protein